MRRVSLNIVALGLIAGWAGGCESSALEADPAFLAALPKIEAVRLDLPGAPSTKDYGDEAGMYRSTARYASNVNSSVENWLLLIDFITANVPASVSGDQHVWGPHPGMAPTTDFRVTMNRAPNGSFTWFLDQGRRNDFAATFVTVVSGTAEAGASGTDARGTLRFDYDAAASLDVTFQARGALEITYDVSPAGKDIVVEYLQYSGASGENPIDATYHYHSETGAAGWFDFVGVGDMDALTPDAALYPNPERYTHRTRWTALGAGRTDVLVTGVDLTTRGIDEYRISECWDATFGSVFKDVSETSGGQTEHDPDGWGDVSECPYADFQPTAP